MNHKLGKILTTIFLIFCFTRSLACAADEYSFGAYPLKIKSDLRKNESIERSITIYNTTSTDQDYLVEVKKLTFINGSGNYTLEEVTKTDGVNITLPLEKIHVQENNVETFKVSISASNDILSGEKYYLILISSTKSKDNHAEPNVSITGKIGVFLLLNVENGVLGESLSPPEITFTVKNEFNFLGSAQFTGEIKNPNSQHLDTSGEIIIYDKNNQEVERIPIDGMIVTPNSSRTITIKESPTIKWNNQTAFGPYHAILELSTDTGITRQVITDFYMINVPIGVFIMFLFATTMVIIIHYIRVRLNKKFIKEVVKPNISA